MAINVRSGVNPAAALTAAVGGAENEKRKRVQLQHAQDASLKERQKDAQQHQKEMFDKRADLAVDQDRLDHEQSLERMDHNFNQQQEMADIAQQRRHDDIEFGYTAQQEAEREKLSNALALVQSDDTFTADEKAEAREQLLKRYYGIQPVPRKRRSPAELYESRHIQLNNGNVHEINEDGSLGRVVSSSSGEERGMGVKDRLAIDKQAREYATRDNVFDQRAYDSYRADYGIKPVQSTDPRKQPVTPENFQAKTNKSMQSVQREDIVKHFNEDEKNKYKRTIKALTDQGFSEEHATQMAFRQTVGLAYNRKQEAYNKVADAGYEFYYSEEQESAVKDFNDFRKVLGYGKSSENDGEGNDYVLYDRDGFNHYEHSRDSFKMIHSPKDKIEYLQGKGSKLQADVIDSKQIETIAEADNQLQFAETALKKFYKENPEPQKTSMGYNSTANMSQEIRTISHIFWDRKRKKYYNDIDKIQKRKKQLEQMVLAIKEQALKVNAGR